MVNRALSARGVALIMVLLVLSILAIIGAPFVISMSLQDKSSLNFSGAVAAREAARAAANHAIVHLEKTTYGYEFEEEEEVLDSERPAGSLRRDNRGTKSSSVPRRSTAKHGLVRRKDQGEKETRQLASSGRSNRFARTASGRNSVQSSEKDGGKDKEKEPRLPEALRQSQKGPSPRDFDLTDELVSKPLDAVSLPAGSEPSPLVASASTTFVASAIRQEFRFQDPTGISASAVVTDEQGKINLNTAPPNLLANLFAVSQLAQPLTPQAEKVFLDDASAFPGDDDPASLDGAVVIVDADVGCVEAVTYRKKAGDVLDDCFRGAFLSLVLNHTYPVGSFVYDLRGWKAAYHRLWAQDEGGFHPRTLHAFTSVESIREIAGWQIASLFVTRFRGEGFTAEFLSQMGVSLKKLSDVGLDPYLFAGAGVDEGPELKKRYEEARKALRKVGFKSDLVTRLKDSRGARVVIDLAAQLDGADKQRIDKVEEALEKSIAADKRAAPRIPEKYLNEALRQLVEAYKTPGIETVGPEELEWLRDCVTTSSWLPAQWSESQSVLDDVLIAGKELSARVARANEINPWTIVRIRSQADPSFVEFNEAAPLGNQIPHGGMRFAFPLRASLKGYDATVQALERHPVNANTAGRRVLRAVFTGVRGYEKDQVVSPYEADRLAVRLEGARPLKSHDDLAGFLEGAASAGVIGSDDVQPLLINAVAPTSNYLKVSTTGFTYASGDVYSVEARGVLRSPVGGTVAEARFRELVEVSAPRRLTLGLLTQSDFVDGTYLKDPLLTKNFPENNYHYLLQFPGTRSHLVLSRPLLLHRAILAFPGGDLGNLRLFPAETPETNERYRLGEVQHFRNTYEGAELAADESWAVDLSLAQGNGTNPSAAQRPPVAAAQGPGVEASFLNMVPGGIEFWFRMRSYPAYRNADGHLILFDAGSEEERNRIQLLYADKTGSLRLRIYDASVRDPSIVRNRDNGQYLEVNAQKPLELETWYHLRAVWDGVYGGGAQLFIDGIPAGTDNLSTELTGSLPESGSAPSIPVRDASKFPREGVVRIDDELFEYVKNGNSLKVREMPPSHWQPLKRWKLGAGRGRIEPPPEQPRRPGGRGNEASPQEAATTEPQMVVGPGLLADSAALADGAEELAQAGPGVPPTPAVDLTTMRAPGNRRGSVPSAHTQGARVALHGYSLPMRRKIRDLKTGAEFQVPENDAQRLIWGSAGLRSLEMLPAFNFPNDISGIVHIDFDEQDVAGSDGEYVVPLFHLDSGNAVLGGLFMDFMTSMTTLGSRNAADYFQSKGILTVGGDAFFYRKEPLPPQYVQAQMKFARQIRQPQTMGLRILADYEPVAGGGGLRRWKALKESNRRYRSFPGVAVINRPVTQRSLLVAGGIRGLYPETGVIEMRGSPTPWEATYRPSYFGQPAFGKNPDDVVEWLRYTSIVDGPYAGEDFHLLVGRLNATYNFRGYPERDDPSLGVDLRKQLDLPPQPIRLVMELSEGGAGYGDYVTIATRDPNIYEPVVRRVYKVLEHEDGRFFASLLDVGETGLDTPMSPGRYKNSYTMDMNPRLVKFPAWGLPEVGAATGLIFGDAIQGGGSTGGKGGRSNAGGVRYDEDEDQTGITLDEVKLLQNQTIRRDPRYSVRHVLVPLDGGTVTFRQGGQGGASISGRIPPGRAISRSSPLEVLVVTLSREPGFPTLFAQGEEEGVLRIGDELFYFEDPLGQGKGGGQVKPGIATLARAPADPRGPQPNPPQNPQDPNQVVIETSRERDPLARSTVTENLPTQNLSGHFEKEGFARMADERYTAAGGATYPSETFNFYEIFYYRRLQGGFATCLRGQFETPLLLRLSDQAASGQVRVHNVTRRLRLVGRGLLGTQRVAHSLGEGVTHVPYLQMQSITGPITNTGLPVKKAKDFAPSGYLLLDSGQSGVPWEICAHIGPQGEGLLVRPRDERGKGILRACFGTKEQPLSNDMFAYEMPYRYPDRYEAEADSESFAYLQKSYRVPGAYWRSLEWTERKSRARREHRSDIVVLARFDGAPEWDVKPTNEAGGLYLFEATDRRDDAPAGGDLNQVADQLEIRVYFRFPSGAFSRIGENIFTDDWKETPVLESLRIEYEKAGTVLRHEELPF